MSPLLRLRSRTSWSIVWLAVGISPVFVACARDECVGGFNGQCPEDEDGGGADVTTSDGSAADVQQPDVSPFNDAGVPDGSYIDATVCAVTTAKFSGQIWGYVTEGVSYNYTTTGCILFDPDNQRYATADGQRYGDPSCSGTPLGIIHPDGGYDYMCDNAAGHSLVAAVDEAPPHTCTSDSDCTTPGTHCADAQHQPLSGVCPDMTTSECPNVCVFTQCIQLGIMGNFVAPASGNLHLYFNDNFYSDNTNAWNVCFSGLAPPVIN